MSYTDEQPCCVTATAKKAAMIVLYIMVAGLAWYGPRLLRQGSVWGQDCVLADQSFVKFTARMLTYCETLSISGTELLGIAKDFPRGLNRIRWTAVRLALKRCLEVEKEKKDWNNGKCKQRFDGKHP